MRVTYTRSAQATIRHILADLYAENPMAAAHLSARIEESAAHLGRFPELGRTGRVPGTRELVMRNTRYILVYRLQPSALEILDVRHTSRKR